MSATDYKKKYLELRSKYMNAIDVSYRKGYEKGFQESQVQSQAQQAQAQQEQMMAMAQQQQQMQGQPEQPMSPEEQAMQDQQMQQMQDQGQEPQEPTELDQQIEQLQGLLQKGEKPSYVALRDITIKIADLRKAEMEKKKLPKLQPEQKQEIALQAKIVKDLAKKWKEESQQAAHDIIKLL